MTAPINQGGTSSADATVVRVAAALREQRVQSHRNRYGGGRLPQLPSRTAVIEMADAFVSAMFPRHFGPPGLTGEIMDAFVTCKLAAALRSLGRQARFDLELAADPDQAPGTDVAARADDIAEAFAEDLPNIRALLETDIRAAYEGDPAAISLDEVIACYPGVAAIVRHRLAHRLHRLGARLVARIISEAAHSATGVDIHPGAEIGESFFIDHGTGVVIGETAVIGRRVRLYQGVTLGARRFVLDEHGGLAKDYPRHPIIEDDVVIYAGASVLGRITVGRGATIAGSVWLTEDVPAGATVTQAKIRSESFHDGGGI